MRYNGLRGDGFIALQSDDPACNFIEHDSLEDAQAWAAMRGKGQAVFIVYAPVAIVRPRIESQIEVTSVADKMIKKLGGGKK